MTYKPTTPPPSVPPVTYESELQTIRDMEKDPKHPGWGKLEYTAAARARLVKHMIVKLDKKYGKKPTPKPSAFVSLWGRIVGLND